MVPEKLLFQTISELYAASLDQTRWLHALELLAESVGAQAATLWTLDSSDQPRLPSFLSHDFDPSFIDEYLAHMTAQDPTVQYLVKNPNLPIVHDGLYLTDREIDRHAYYDWHFRHTDARYRLLAQINPEANLQAGIALHRTKAQGRYESQDIDTLNILFPHIERALSIGFRLGALEDMQAKKNEIIENMHSGIVLLDHRGRILYANQRAGKIASRNDGIQMAGGNFSLSKPDDNKKISCLIFNALEKSVDKTKAGGAMVVQRGGHKTPYYLLISPIAAGQMLLTSQQPAVCIYINDPSSQRPLCSKNLRALFGLTESEARLAIALAEGTELREAAELLGISYGTARTRLADIFTKTHTRRQAELVRLLLHTAG